MYTTNPPHGATRTGRFGTKGVDYGTIRGAHLEAESVSARGNKIARGRGRLEGQFCVRV